MLGRPNYIYFPLKTNGLKSYYIVRSQLSKTIVLCSYIFVDLQIFLLWIWRMKGFGHSLVFSYFYYGEESLYSWHVLSHVSMHSSFNTELKVLNFIISPRSPSTIIEPKCYQTLKLAIVCNTFIVTMNMQPASKLLQGHLHVATSKNFMLKKILVFKTKT